MGLSPEEIARVKQEWEEQQKRRKEKEDAKKKENEDKEKADKEKEDGKGSKDSSKKTTPKVLSPVSSTPSAPSTPTHQRFTLHRDMFALRLSEHRKRRQAAQAKLLAPRLPGAPQGGFP
jgi:hypothetical protein